MMMVCRCCCFYSLLLPWTSTKNTTECVAHCASTHLKLTAIWNDIFSSSIFCCCRCRCHRRCRRRRRRRGRQCCCRCRCCCVSVCARDTEIKSIQHTHTHIHTLLPACLFYSKQAYTHSHANTCKRINNERIQTHTRMHIHTHVHAHIASHRIILCALWC